MNVAINIRDRTREEWSQAHAEASVWYAVLAMIVGLPLQIAGVASGDVIVGVALIGYLLMTAHFVNQIFLKEQIE